MTIKLPKIIGHRGAAAYAPENTLESIQTAADLGIEWVELDVKLTRDQVPIIFHDDTLERTTGVTGKVADISYADIAQLDAGSWFGDSFIGVKIPTLEEAVNVLIERDMGLNLEIKPCPGREKETAEVALDVLSKIWDDHERLLISSFQHVSLEAARDVARDWHRGLLIGGEEMPENWREMAEYLDVTAMNLGTKFITREIAEAVAAEDYKCLVYTVNDPDLARTLQGWGVDSLFSDEPDLIRDALFSVH